MAIWATIWAPATRLDLVGAAPDGPAGCGVGLLDAMAGLARCSALRWRASVRASYGLEADACCRGDADALDAGVAVVCELPAAVVGVLARYRGLVSSASITRRALS